MSNQAILLVERIERRFGIPIGEEQLHEIQTIGQLIDHLTAQAKILHARPCPAAWFFYRLRSVLTSEMPLPRKAVRPHAPLRELIGFWPRRRVWRALQYEFGYQLPRLVWPVPLRIGLLSACAAVLVAMVWGAIAAAAWEYLFVLPFIWALVCWVMMMAAFPFGRAIPEEVATPAAVVAYLMPFQDMPWKEDATAIEPWVEQSVREVIASTLDMHAHELNRETHFQHDLGLK